MGRRRWDGHATGDPRGSRPRLSEIQSRGGSLEMVWLTWRQHRIALIGLLIVATVMSVAVALVASFALRTRVELGIDTCEPNFFGFGDPNNCNSLFAEWTLRVGM